MAIDSTGKKLSLLNYMRVDHIVLPEGDGSFDGGDKLHFLNLYSGLAAAALVLGPYCVVAGEVFVAGAVINNPTSVSPSVAGEVFVAGPTIGELFVAGAEAGQGGCN